MDPNLQKFLDILSGKIYHGTKGGADIKKGGFRPSKAGNLGRGVYATPIKDIAEMYSRAARGGTAAENRAKLRSPSTVLKGNIPYGTKLFDFTKDQIPKVKDMAQLGLKLRQDGYDGIKMYSPGMKEVNFFDPRVANQAFRVGGQRLVPKAPQASVGAAVFDLVGKPLVQALFETIGQPGQSNMSQLDIKPRSN